MKKIVWIVLAGLLIFFGWRAFSHSKKRSTPHTVYYYPKANVYFNEEEATYIYFSNEEKRWIETQSFSESQRLSLGERAIITAPPTPVWKNNESDRMIYSAQLYGPADLQQKFREDSLFTLPKKEAPTIVRTNPSKEANDSVKPKSGLGRFLEKLFGRKKKEK